jgi:hypothetical protein
MPILLALFVLRLNNLRIVRLNFLFLETMTMMEGPPGPPKLLITIF